MGTSTALDDLGCESYPARNYISRLPPEMVSEIASWEVELSCTNFYEVMLRRYELGLLSHHIRDGVLGASRVWNEVEIHPWSSVDYIKMCIIRAVGDVVVRFVLHPFANTPHYIGVKFRRTLRQTHAEMLPLLTVLFHRVSRLHVSADGLNDIWRSMHLLAPYEWDRLRAVKISDAALEVRRPAGISQTAFWLPQPQSLELLGIPLRAFHHSIYTSITVLHIGVHYGPIYHCDATDLVEVLAATSRLEVLQLTDVHCKYVEKAQPATLPYVTHFLFKYHSEENVDVVGLIDLPALENLCVSALADATSLNRLHKHCPLFFAAATHFELCVEYTSLRDFSSIFSHMTRLEVFVLRSSSVLLEDPFLNFSWFLPRLQVMSLPHNFPLEYIRGLVTQLRLSHGNVVVATGTGASVASLSTPAAVRGFLFVNNIDSVDCILRGAMLVPLFPSSGSQSRNPDPQFLGTQPHITVTASPAIIRQYGSNQGCVVGAKRMDTELLMQGISFVHRSTFLVLFDYIRLIRSASVPAHEVHSNFLTFRSNLAAALPEGCPAVAALHVGESVIGT
ncbi:hypothetical protein C8R43DRAFT_942370 [Mycena crocata]|nr:hypothetical protein C8R43DRAFT_942370 [Mycena crocata]